MLLPAKNSLNFTRFSKLQYRSVIQQENIKTEISQKNINIPLTFSIHALRKVETITIVQMQINNNKKIREIDISNEAKINDQLCILQLLRWGIL